MQGCHNQTNHIGLIEKEDIIGISSGISDQRRKQQVLR